MKRILVAPSILAADFADMRNEVKRIDRAGADRVHIDVMDGHFVNNITFGPALISSIRSATDLPFETHLMIERPDLYIKQFSDAGSDILIVHVEADHTMARTLRMIKACRKRAGIALNPNTPVSAARKYMKDIDMLLMMSVYPGFGGQKFIGSVLKKIKEVRRIDGSRLTIGVDGGVNVQTAEQAIRAGANEMIAGTTVFKARSYGRAISELRCPHLLSKL